MAAMLILISILRTCLELRNRILPLKDRSGEPLLPLFLYEESMVDGSVTKGLFRGPLLLKVSVEITFHPGHHQRVLVGLSCDLSRSFPCVWKLRKDKKWERQDPWHDLGSSLHGLLRGYPGKLMCCPFASCLPIIQNRHMLH